MSLEWDEVCILDFSFKHDSINLETKLFFPVIDMLTEKIVELELSLIVGTILTE